MSSSEFASASSGSCSQASCASSEDCPCCWICLGGSEGGEQLLAPCGCPRLVHRSCLSRWQLQQAGKQEGEQGGACRREGRKGGMAGGDACPFPSPCPPPVSSPRVCRPFASRPLPCRAHMPLLLPRAARLAHSPRAAAQGHPRDGAHVGGRVGAAHVPQSHAGARPATACHGTCILTSSAALPSRLPHVQTVVYNNETHSILVQPGPEGEARFIREVRRIFQLSESAELSLSFGCRLPNGQGEVTLEGAQAFGAAAFLASLSAGERVQHAAAQQAQQEARGGESPTPAQPAPSRWRRLF